MSVWKLIDEATDTRAMEIPGVGVVIANSCGMTTVLGARLQLRAGVMTVTRENRTTPPLHSDGLTAAEIVAKQPLVVDPGALSYIVDTEAAEY